MPHVPNHLNFLRALDEYTRKSSRGCVTQGHEMHSIARDAGLVESGNPSPAAFWTGELVELGYLQHGPASAGDIRPIVRGSMWGETDLQRFSDYRLTGEGRAEADRIRRREREEHTDATLGRQLPQLFHPWMSPDQRRAISEPAEALRDALDADRSRAAIGAAKDLAEAVCKIMIERAGKPASRSGSLPTLFKHASESTELGLNGASDLARGLVATVQRLSELRNEVGAGHGHAAIPKVPIRDAHLAAGAACAVAVYLLAFDERSP